jgi:hypothetical protein
MKNGLQEPVRTQVKEDVRKMALQLSGQMNKGNWNKKLQEFSGQQRNRKAGKHQILRKAETHQILHGPRGNPMRKGIYSSSAGLWALTERSPS